MKKCFVQILTVLFVMSIFASPALAQLKVGVVDFQKIIALSKSGSKAKANFEPIVVKRQKELQTKKETVIALREEFVVQMQSNLLNPLALKDKENKLNDKILDYQRTLEDVQKQLRREEGKLMESMIIDIQKVINALGKKEAFDLILEKAQSAALFSSDKIDITDKVIKLLDAANNLP